jgi:hypothetical protein
MCHQIPKEVEFDLKYFPGLSIDIQRLSMARYAQENNFDMIIMVDDDMICPPDTIVKFIQHYDCGKDVVSAMYMLKNYPFNLFLNKFDRQFGDWDMVYEDGLHRVKMFGTGCIMIRTSIFKQLEMPYFLLRKDILGNLTGTEDCYFAMNCYLHDIEAYLDASIECEHIKVVTFPEFFVNPNITYNGKLYKDELPNSKHIGNVWKSKQQLPKNYGRLAVSPLTMSYRRDGIDKCAHARQTEIIVNKGEEQVYQCLDCGLISTGITPMKMLQNKISGICSHGAIKHGVCVYCGVKESELGK